MRACEWSHFLGTAGVDPALCIFSPTTHPKHPCRILVLCAAFRPCHPALHLPLQQDWSTLSRLTFLSVFNNTFTGSVPKVGLRQQAVWGPGSGQDGCLILKERRSECCVRLRKADVAKSWSESLVEQVKADRTCGWACDLTVSQRSPGHSLGVGGWLFSQLGFTLPGPQLVLGPCFHDRSGVC